MAMWKKRQKENAKTEAEIGVMLPHTGFNISAFVVVVCLFVLRLFKKAVSV